MIIRASFPGMSASAFVMSGVTTASWAISRPPKAHSRTATTAALRIFWLRFVLSSFMGHTTPLRASGIMLDSLPTIVRRGRSGGHGLDHGLAEPFLEADIAQRGIGTRHQRPLAQLRAEVSSMGVGDHFTGIVACAETQSDERVKAKLLWPRDLDDAVHRSRLGDPTHRLRDVLRRYGLEQHGGDAHRIPVGGLVCDALKELEELRGADDRVRDRRVSDQLLLGDLRSEVAAVGRPVAADDRQRDVMTHTRRRFGGKEIGGGRLEELEHGRVLE